MSGPVDLVFEGGGVKGVGLAGAYAALEEENWVALFSPGKKTGDVVGGRATGFATKASARHGTYGHYRSCRRRRPADGSISVDPAIKVAALGLIGLGAVAWSIAATGDVLARAYASAHVVPGNGNGSPTPGWAMGAYDRDSRGGQGTGTGRAGPRRSPSHVKFPSEC